MKLKTIIKASIITSVAICATAFANNQDIRNVDLIKNGDLKGRAGVYAVACNNVIYLACQQRHKDNTAGWYPLASAYAGHILCPDGTDSTALSTTTGSTFYTYSSSSATWSPATAAPSSCGTVYAPTKQAE